MPITATGVTGVLPIVGEHNMPLMRRVLFWGKLDRAAPLIDALREIATAHSATPIQVALAWLITHYGDKPRTCSVTPNSVWSNRLMNATRLSSVGSKGEDYRAHDLFLGLRGRSDLVLVFCLDGGLR
jgi:diketogulonate reductase-like aldo/keto reductase